MTLAKEKQSYDGEAAKISKAIKTTSSFSGKYSTENYAQGNWGDVFYYNSLNGESKKLIDWFFDADIPVDLEYEGLTADEVSKKLVGGHLPQGFNLEKLKSWILGIKESTKF